MTSDSPASALGLDFGTTNTVAALADGKGGSHLIEFAGEGAAGAVFRSALCFWEEERALNGIAHEAGPWAIAEYLQSPLDSRFIQSFKSVAASPSFERALIDGPDALDARRAARLDRPRRHVARADHRRPQRPGLGGGLGGDAPPPAAGPRRPRQDRPPGQRRRGR